LKTITLDVKSLLLDALSKLLEDLQQYTINYDNDTQLQCALNHIKYLTECKGLPLLKRIVRYIHAKYNFLKTGIWTITNSRLLFHPTIEHSSKKHNIIGDAYLFPDVPQSKRGYKYNDKHSGWSEFDTSKADFAYMESLFKKMTSIIKNTNLIETVYGYIEKVAGISKVLLKAVMLKKNDTNNNIEVKKKLKRTLIRSLIAYKGCLSKLISNKYDGFTNKYLKYTGIIRDIHNKLYDLKDIKVNIKVYK